MIVAELFTQGPRVSAMSISVLINWACNFAVGYVFPIMQVTQIHLIIFALCKTRKINVIKFSGEKYVVSCEKRLDVKLNCMKHNFQDKFLMPGNVFL